jgi:glycosyltransferase involved in cell wall biosynthesis
MRFAVFTHVEHIKNANQIYAYAPYVREMNLWFSQVKEVEIVAPISEGEINPILLKYDKTNMNFISIPKINILSASSVFKLIFQLPIIIKKIHEAMFKADHIHLRCPGNIGLIACFIQIFFPKKPKTVKYAGNWDPNSKQPWSYRLQKWILSNTFLSKNIKVLVYGDWKEQTKNIVPFFTASFMKKEKGLNNKEFTSPFKFIFVGNLSHGKRPLFSVKLIECLMGKGFPVKLEIYGSGVLKNELHEYIAANNLNSFVRLMGNCKLEELKEVYKTSHFLILASQSEGWPKAIAEGMFYGCIPIATSVSCVPWMLDHGKRGMLVTEDMKQTVHNMLNILKDKSKLKIMSKEAQRWSEQFTLEKFESEINKMF